MALPVVDRYVLFECVRVWLAVIVVLAVLTLGLGFARFIAAAAAGDLAARTVFVVAGFSALQHLEIVLPVSVLLAVMLTVGRLCADNEMAALAAGGVGLGRLYRPFGVFALLLAGVAAWLSLSVAPHAGRAVDRLRDIGGALILQTVEPGRFIAIAHGHAVFYAGSVDRRTGAMHDVFIRLQGAPGDRRRAPGTETVVVAKSAEQKPDPQTGARTLVLYHGWRYEGAPGHANYRVTRFAEHGVRLRPPVATGKPDLADADTTTLLARHDLPALAQLQQRIATPVAVLLLALLALPLGFLPPRSGRYGKLVFAILIYVAYVNTLRLGQLWLANGQSPRVLGLWWVHLPVVGLALFLIARHQGLLRARPGVK